MSEPVTSHRATHWMVGAFGIGALLHLGQMPLWVTVLAGGCAAWALAAAHGRARLPGRALKAVLTVVLTGAVLVMFRTLNGLTAGSALLVLMGAIKLLEATTRRDRLIVVGVGFYLLLAACLASQELVRAPLYLLHCWVCCTALLYAAHPDAPMSSHMAGRISARSLGFALPLALLLFALFPRLSGSFWSLGGSGQAQTGLSDTMSPGSISELGNSADPVFRVWFDGPLPAPQERYWRGPVLHDFDGYTWTRAHGAAYKPETLQYLGAAYQYQIRLEPDSGPWWPALDTVQSTTAHGASITPDRQLVALRPAHDALTYTAVSYTATHSPDALSRIARQFDSYVVPERNPRSQALARRMRATAADVPGYVNSVIALFRAGRFEYTLTPPRLDLNSVDDFLFNTRRGFCGHFASAFALLMRAGGVPARVVTGYQGGEWNPIGGYLLIRRSDAHAWVEVWEDGRGWVRVDPTAVVAPERLRRGILDLLPGAGSVPERLLHDFVAAGGASGLGRPQRLVEHAGRRVQLQLPTAAAGIARLRCSGLAAAGLAAGGLIDRVAAGHRLAVRPAAAGEWTGPIGARLSAAVRTACALRAGTRSAPRATRLCRNPAQCLRTGGTGAGTAECLCPATLRQQRSHERTAARVRAAHQSLAAATSACSRVSRNVTPGQRSSVRCRFTREGAR